MNCVRCASRRLQLEECRQVLVAAIVGNREPLRKEDCALRPEHERLSRLWIGRLVTTDVLSHEHKMQLVDCKPFEFEADGVCVQRNECFVDAQWP